MQWIRKITIYEAHQPATTVGKLTNFFLTRQVSFIYKRVSLL